MTVPLSAAARWREVVSTPLRVGATDLVDSLGKIGGAIFANTVRNSAVETALKAVRGGVGRLPSRVRGACCRCRGVRWT